MKIENFEKNRRKYYPIYLAFLVIAFLLMLATIVVLIFIKLDIEWWQFLLIALASMFLIFLSIFISDRIEKNYFNKYNKLFQKEIVRPIILELFDNDIDYYRELNLSNVNLIGKAHKYRVLNQIHGSEYSIFEISMLRDFRFRGLVIVKPLNKHYDPFIMMNYNYYFKPKIDEFNIKTNNEAFDNRYLLYSSAPDFKMPLKMTDKLFNRLQTFKHVGVMIKDDVAYYVLGHRLTNDNHNLLNISLIEPIDEDIEMKIKIFLQKIQAIAEYNFD